MLDRASRGSSGKNRVGVSSKVRNVLPAGHSNCGKRARADAEIIGARPIPVIVRGTKSWSRVIRDFVLLVARVFQHRHREIEKLRVGIGVLPKLAAGVTQKEFGVFLVSQTVSRNVFRPEGDRSLQGLTPLVDGLSRQSKHQIDV